MPKVASPRLPAIVVEMSRLWTTCCAPAQPLLKSELQSLPLTDTKNSPTPPPVNCSIRSTLVFLPSSVFWNSRILTDRSDPTNHQSHASLLPSPSDTSRLRLVRSEQGKIWGLKVARDLVLREFTAAAKVVLDKFFSPLPACRRRNWKRRPNRKRIPCLTGNAKWRGNWPLRHSAETIRGQPRHADEAATWDAPGQFAAAGSLIAAQPEGANVPKSPTQPELLCTPPLQSEQLLR
ncbi:hypothetical protein MRX96_006194 [Rhipicephalus microplus]